MSSGDTIFAHSSGRPPAAIAVLRISGPRAHHAAALLAGRLPRARTCALRTLRDRSGIELDRALLLRFDAPASATGEDLVELHCHGGRAVIDALLGTLARLEGLREAQPGEFTRRALENGRIDLTEAEGLADLLEAETESQRRAALAGATGGLRHQVERWREELVSLSAMAEAAIDYVGDEDETAADEQSLAERAQELADDIDRWLAEPRAERLREGIRIVLAGPPNAGKSSLLNALVGEQRAIVTEAAGTTRDVIEVPVALGGLPLVLVDTAGLRDSSDTAERIGVERAAQQIETADIVLWLGEPWEAPGHPAIILVHPQVDRPGRSEVPTGTIAVSAMTGQGLPDLRGCVLEQARGLLPVEGRLALNQRQASVLADVSEALRQAESTDLILTAEALRSARGALARVSGATDVDSVLDALFGRFCLGK